MARGTPGGVSGREENTFVPALYFVNKKDANGVGDVVMMMVTHVDDLAWSDTPECQGIIQYIKGKFPSTRRRRATSSSRVTRSPRVAISLCTSSVAIRR